MSSARQRSQPLSSSKELFLHANALSYTEQSQTELTPTDPHDCLHSSVSPFKQGQFYKDFCCPGTAGESSTAHFSMSFHWIEFTDREILICMAFL